MRPAPASPLSCLSICSRRTVRHALSLAILTCALPAFAQEGPPQPVTQQPAPAQSRQVDFEADAVDYDSQGDVVTARGNVILRSEDQSVRADTVAWQRDQTRAVRAFRDGLRRPPGA